MSSSGNIVDLRYYKGVLKLDATLHLLDRFRNPDSEEDAMTTRADLAQVIVRFCTVDPEFKQDLGLTSEQLSKIAEGRQIPDWIVRRFADLIKKAREHAASCLKREAV